MNVDWGVDFTGECVRYLSSLVAKVEAAAMGGKAGVFLVVISQA